MIPWFWAFVCTQIIEMPIYRFALARIATPPKRAWLVAFGASALTHPIVWLVFPRLFHRWIEADDRGYWWMIAAAEAFAVIVEALWLRWFGLRRALVWSIVANGASFGLGSLTRALWGVP